ncbi:MAG: hypothetical protein LKE49_02380 [Bifidobacterium tibiigranuli]|nr:hypothetical protein [Bifidobacterium tibiigranuli]MCH3973890.1 hypothetical protein [Bifidobacterium tibiigranuli]
MAAAATKQERELAERVLPKDAKVSVVVEPVRHGAWRHSLYGQESAVRAVPAGRFVRISCSGASGAGGAAHPASPALPRHEPTGARHDTECLAQALVLGMPQMKRLGKEQREITKETTAEAGSAAVTSLPRNQVEALWGDHVQLDLCIASLDEDGLIEILPDGSLRLPQ